jgi:hypothetical protein
MSRNATLSKGLAKMHAITETDEHEERDLRSLIPADARERLVRLDQNTRELVREHPALAILGAIGLGYFVGRIVARW